MVQDHIQHLRREAALVYQRFIAPARMLADFTHFLVRQFSRLVQDRHRNEGLADIVQKGGAHQAALIVVAHPEMLRERNRKAGDKEAMTIGVRVVAADSGQPFTQRGMLDGFENLVLGLHDIGEFQRNSRRKFLEYLDHHLVGGGHTAVQRLAAIRRVEAVAVRKRGADALQDSLRVERPRYRIGGAQRPRLHRAMMKGVGKNEQTRHRTVSLVL